MLRKNPHPTASKLSSTTFCFPWPSPAILGSGVLVALLCKRRAAAAMRDGDCDGYLRWHAAWHYTLPAAAIAGQLQLHTPCDYASFGYGSDCVCA